MFFLIASGPMDMSYHIPVLVEPVLRHLLHTPDGIYVDGTLGGGGHAEAILTHLSDHGRLIGLDADTDAISFSGKRLHQFGARFRCIHDNFANIKHALHAVGVKRIDGILLDLGISSHQVDEDCRGFSYRNDVNIDMRMDQSGVLDGREIINHYSQTKLAELFWKFGEERYSRKIAACIVKVRSEHLVQTTGDLRSVIQEAVGPRFLTNTLARIFQAIRIEVNHELDNLQTILRDSIGLLHSGGRIVVISYHSLEDRIVKSFFKNESAESHPSQNKLIPDVPCQPTLSILTKKPIIPSDEEIARNPRARSAKLRVAERLG
jgi:16S rRNA (cytosine1402-N4)-methyltransferase